MSRFSSVVLALALAGCSGTPATVAPLVRQSEAPPSAFGVAPEALHAALQEVKLKLDPAEVLGADFAEVPCLRLMPEEAASREAGPLQPIVAILREFVAPGLWDAKSLSLEKDVLVVRHAPEVLTAILSALQTLRANRGRTIQSDVRLMALPADRLSRLENISPIAGGLVGTFDRKALTQELRKAPPLDPAPAALVSLSRSGLSLNRREEASKDVLSAPRLTLLHGQQGQVMFVDQKAYVAGYQGLDGKGDPQVEVATEGIVVQLRSIANGTRPGEFLLSFEIQVASPTELVNVQLGSGSVEMPAQGYARVSGRCALRTDQALLLVTRNPDPRQTERPLLAMVIMLDWAE